MPLGSPSDHIPQLLLHSNILSHVLFSNHSPLDKELTSLIAHQTANWKGRYHGRGLAFNTTGVIYCGGKERFWCHGDTASSTMGPVFFYILQVNLQ